MQPRSSDHQTRPVDHFEEVDFDHQTRPPTKLVHSEICPPQADFFCGF
jgi:hypothetical protein